jgi:signal transduction histidine kinase
VERSTFGEGRWWDVFFAAIVLLLVGIVLQDSPELSSADGGALVTLVVLSIAYATLSRRAWRDHRFAAILTAILILGTGIGTAFHPSVATIQAIVFPLIWSFIDDLRRGLVANVALALVTAVALTVALGGSASALAQAATIESISLVGSVALAVWFTRVEQLSAERQRLLDELTAAQDQLAEMHRHSGVTSERERLAREIHDTIAQSLTGVIMLSQQAQRELSSGDVDTLADRLALLEVHARDVLVETRSLVAGGAPVELGLGIGAALERLAERFARETGVSVEAQIGEAAREPGLLSRDTEVVLLRCAQESLANIRKHSKASAATIRLEITGSSAELTLSDNGVGFDPEHDSLGFGLSGMRDRLALAGGSLELGTPSAAHPAPGFVVRVILPLVAPTTEAVPASGAAAAILPTTTLAAGAAPAPQARVGTG